MQEVEIRAKVGCEILDKIKEIGGELKDVSEISDHYYKFKHDEKRKLLIRVRRKNGKSFLTFKGEPKGNDDTTWDEWNQEIQNPEILEKLFLDNEVITLINFEKKRYSFRLDKFEIIYDEIINYGNYIEAELIDEEKSIALKKLNELFNKLGINEEQIMNEGYVQHYIGR